MSYTETKNAFKEESKKELIQGVKECLKAIGGGLLISIGVYLYGSHSTDFGQHLGRAEILDKLTDAAEELESSNEDNKN